MHILYLGSELGTSKHRAEALKRLGHSVYLLNPERFVPKSTLQARLHWESGGILCEAEVTKQVIAHLAQERYDLVWVDNGRYVGPTLVKALKQVCGSVINFNVDDPYGRRDRFSWSLYRKTVPFYDLIVVVRTVNVQEAYVRGAKKVLHVFRSADEIAHAPRDLTSEDHEKWDSEVLFVGTWMEKRGLFMAELLRLGVPLTIRGDRWHKAPEWKELQKAWNGPGTRSDDEYAKVIQCSKISLGLLSKGNRDDHTQRTMEVPSLGGLLCAERTGEHVGLYRDGEEAMFWSDAAECATRCQELLGDDERRRDIAWRGQRRYIENGHLNEKIISEILAESSC